MNSSPQSPSPQAKIFPRALYSSSFAPSPAFSSTIPFPQLRPTSASAVRRPSSVRNKPSPAASRRRRTHSAASSLSPATTPRKFSTTELTRNLAKNLAKLGEKEPGMAMSKGDPQVEGSSEYPGPRDFTMNMESYITSPKKWQTGQDNHVGDAEEDSDDEDAQHRNEEDEGDTSLDTENEPREKVTDESEFEPLSTSTPAPWANQKCVGLQLARSAQDRKFQALSTSRLDMDAFSKLPGQVSSEGELEPRSPLVPTSGANQKSVGTEAARSTENKTLQSRPVSQFNAENLQNRAAEDVPDQISALQAEVIKLRLGDESNRYINEMLRRAHVSDQEENGRLKAELQTVKEEVVKWQAQANALEKAAALEQKARDFANAKVGSLQAKFRPLVQELAAFREKAEVEKSAAVSKIAELEETIRASQMKLVKDKQDHMIVQDSNQDVINHLRSNLEECQREFSSHQQSLEAKRRASEKEAAKVRDDLKLLKANHEVDLAEQRLELSIPQRALQERIEELMEQVEGMKDLESSLALQKMELDHARDQVRETKCRVETVESENEKLRQAQHSTERVDYDRDRFNEEIERLRKENADMSILLGSKEATIEKLKDEIKSYQAEKHSGNARAEALESALATIKKLKDEINSHEAEKHAGTTQIEAVEAELEQKHKASLREISTTHEKELKVMNSAMVRMADSMRERHVQSETAHQEILSSLHQKIASLEKAVAAGKSRRQSQRESLASLRQEIASMENARTAAKESIPDQQPLKTPIPQQPVAPVSKQDASTESIGESIWEMGQKLASLKKAFAATIKLTSEQQASQNSVLQPAPTENGNAELHEEMRMLSQKYSASIASLHATRLALAQSQQALAAQRAKNNCAAMEMDELRQEVEAQLKQELEEEFKTTMDEREKEWRRRISVMFTEREKMAKALLCAWGKEEVGENVKGEDGERKQGYRYRYV